MPPEAVAGIFGLIGGGIASLISPWVPWFIERRRRSIEYQIDLISCTRQLIYRSENMIEIKSSSLWGFIDKHLTQVERNKALPIRTLSIRKEDGAELPPEKDKISAISQMLSRLEIEWKLLK